MKKLKIAVIGAGRLGGFHAQKLAKMPEEELTAIVDPMPANRQRVAAECRCPAFADYRDLLGRIDAAVIAAPTACHYQLAKDFLESNTHLLVEKPLCLNSREADELVALAQKRNLVLQVGHVERFNPAFSASIPHLSDPKYIETVRTSGYTFRSTDVGVVLDLMIHDLDLVLSIARRPGAKSRCRWAKGRGQRRGRCQRPDPIPKRLRGKSVRIAGQSRIRAADAGLDAAGVYGHRLCRANVHAGPTQRNPAARRVSCRRLFRPSRWSTAAGISPMSICLASNFSLKRWMPWLWKFETLWKPSARTASRWSTARRAAMPWPWPKRYWTASMPIGTLPAATQQPIHLGTSYPSPASLWV